MMGIPTIEQIKTMGDEDLQKFLDALKADEMTALEFLKALAESKKIVITLEPKETTKL